MEKSSLKFYKESGIAPIPSLIFSFLIGSLIIVAISYYYCLLVTYMPFIYINVLITIVFGYSIAVTSHYFFTLFKVRNRKKVIQMSLWLAFIGCYGQWISYCYILSIGSVDLFPDILYFFEWFIRPDYLISNIGLLFDNGAWEIFGITFKGFALLFIWLIEIGIILGTTYYGVANKSIAPFSEVSNKWYTKYTIDVDFEAIKLRLNFIKEYSEDPIAAIKSLKRGDGMRYSRIHIYKTRTDGRSLLSIENVLVTESGRGKKETEEIIAPHYIETNYVSQLMKDYRLKKSSFFDFISEIYS